MSNTISAVLCAFFASLCGKGKVGSRHKKNDSLRQPGNQAIDHGALGKVEDMKRKIIRLPVGRFSMYIQAI
ncbi:hypothetical protein ACFL6I_27500 [candidate division KSB1 bacterium]